MRADWTLNDRELGFGANRTGSVADREDDPEPVVPRSVVDRRLELDPVTATHQPYDGREREGDGLRPGSQFLVEPRGEFASIRNLKLQHSGPADRIRVDTSEQCHTAAPAIGQKL